MDVLLIRPKPHQDSINLQSMMICEPLELEYIAARLEQFGHQTDIVDLILESNELEYFLTRKKYAAVGFTAYLTHVNIVKALAARAHACDPALITLVGGVHAEVNPQDFDTPHIDLVIHGNAMDTLPHVFAMLERSRSGPSAGCGDGAAGGNARPQPPPRRDDATASPGIADVTCPDRPHAVEKQNSLLRAIRSEVAGVWHPGKARPPVATDFPYPFPARHKTAKYRKKYSYSYLSRCASIKTSFGCPYDCNFCFCTCITQKQYFERDLSDVIEEIKTIEEPNLFIVDDNFLLRRERVLEFCGLMAREGIKKQFILFGRADFIAENPDVMERLRNTGLHAVFIGIESFSAADLDTIGKQISVAVNVKAVEIIESLGMNCYCGLIAMPDWRRRDFDNVIRFLKRFKTPIINLQPLTPLPGTDCRAQYEKRLIVPKERYELWDLAHLVIRPLHMSRAEFYKNILRVYYKTAAGPRMHLHILRKYPLEAYFRVLRGVAAITLQYCKMIRESAKQAE